MSGLNNHKSINLFFQKRELLPRLEQEMSFSTEVLRNQVYLERVLEKMADDNPVVRSWIDGYSRAMPRCEDSIYQAMWVYSLLKKSGPVPKVEAMTALSLLEEVRKSNLRNYLADIRNRLQEENPLVLDFIRDFALTSSEPGRSFYAGLMTYRLLERQAEIDFAKGN
jgi:hypothetical protein